MNLFKNLFLIVSIPIILFWIAVGFNFLFFPDDLETASTLIIVLTGTGCFVALFMIIQNLRNIYRNWNDSRTNT